MENIGLGIEVMIVGFAIVMAILYLLYLVLLGFSKCCAEPAKPQIKKENQATPTPSVVNEATPAPVAAAVSQHTYGTAPEIIAAITAAVSVYLGRPANQFEIVAVQPANSGQNGSNWALLGRKRLMEKRQDVGMFRRERR